jgi:hypothetical protein
VGICTGERSNVDDGSDRRNPLGWTLSTLAAQDADISQVLVLKHGEASSGFDELVGRFGSALPIEVESFDRSVPLGELRNRLLDAAGGDLLYILDDDGLLTTPHALSTQVARFASAGPSIAVLQAPVLRRTLQPRVVAPDALRVGLVDADRGEVTFRFDSAILAPSPVPLVDIDHLCLAQSLFDARRARDIGGFTTFPWPAVYGQESELGVRLVADGQRVCFLPDPDTAVVNLKFGAPFWAPRAPTAPPAAPSSDAVLPGGVRYSWADGLAAALDETGDGGWSRKASAGFFADYVSGMGAVFARRGEAGLERFLVNTARRFVGENRLHHPFVLPIEPAPERAAAFADGVGRLAQAGLWPHDRDWSALFAPAADITGTDETIWI